MTETGKRVRGREEMREGRWREGGREDSSNTFRFESAGLQISREPPLQRPLCHGVCRRRRRRGSHHGGRGSGQGYVESENETRRGGRGGGGGGSGGVERKRE